MPEDAAATRRTGLRWLWLALLVIVLDQWTKGLISARFDLYQSEPLLPFVNLTLMHNTGAAFSFLSSAGGWQRWFFITIALAVSAFIGLWLHRLKGQPWLAAALALVLGGALGNVWDRIVYGYVVDFIDVFYGDWHWPAFNVADSAITAGAVMLLIDALWLSKGREEAHG